MTDERVRQRETKVMDVLYTNRPTHSVLRNYRQIHYEKIDHAVVIVHLHTFPYCHALSRKIKANKYVNSDYTLEKIQIFKKIEEKRYSCPGL